MTSLIFSVAVRQAIKEVAKKVTREVAKNVAKQVAKTGAKQMAKQFAKQGAKSLSKEGAKKVAKRFAQYSWPKMVKMGVKVNSEVGEKAAEKHIDKVMPFSWYDLIPIYGEVMLVKQIWELVGNDDLKKAVEGAINDDLVKQILGLPERQTPVPTPESTPEPADPAGGSGGKKNGGGRTEEKSSGSGGSSGSGNNQPNIQGWNNNFNDRRVMQDFAQRIKREYANDDSKGNWVVVFAVERNHPTPNIAGVGNNSRRVKLLVAAGPLAIPKINAKWFQEPAYRSGELSEIPWGGPGHEGRPKVNVILDAAAREVETILKRGNAANNAPPTRMASLPGMKVTYDRLGQYYSIGSKRVHMFEMP